MGYIIHTDVEDDDRPSFSALSRRNPMDGWRLMTRHDYKSGMTILFILTCAAVDNADYITG